jgi:hypothetical protein
MERFFISQFPPCSRGGIDLAPSFLTLSAAYPLNLPTIAPLSLGNRANGGTLWGSVSTSLRSLAFHSFRSSWEGAVPMMPGCGRAAILTWGTCLEVAYLPSKSQMALCALGKCSVRNPPPLAVGKMPVNPHREFLSAPMSSKST